LLEAGPDRTKVKTMRTRRNPQAGWLRRFVRARRFDGNPLRRRSDRAETIVLAGMLVAMAAGGPFVTLAGGGIAHHLAVQVQHSRLASERQVTAVTTQAAPAPVSKPGPGIALGGYPVQARWTAPDGKASTGQVPVYMGTPAGAKQPVWVTLDGQLAAPPLEDFQVSDLTTMGQVASAVGLALILIMARALIGHELDRRRYAAWEADWQGIDPRSSQHK
jgi:hypothetical protein